MVSGNFAYDPDLVPYIDRFGWRDTSRYEPFSVLYALGPALAYGITDFLDVSLVQPFYLDILEGFSPQGSAGDLKLSLKCRVPGSKRRIVDGALLSQFTFGNGHRLKGFFPRQTYYLSESAESENIVPSESVSFFTARKPTWTWALLGSVGKRRFFFHANFGICLTFENTFDNALCAAAGFEVHPADWITLFADGYASPRIGHLKDGTGILNDPFHVSPGITFHSPGGAFLSIGGSWKISSNKDLVYRYRTGEMNVAVRPEPLWQLFVQVGWGKSFIPRDNDRDDILNKDDRCPDQAEDIDDFEDQDGCPDLDNDQDGIADENDSCRNEPEDKDGFKDSDGCPDDDNDNDLVPDSLDQCRDVPEDRDGYADEDGCPDFDNDGDGVADSTDKCMGAMEDRDGFEDDDGCPDLDNDMDAIPDSIDRCPDSAGTAETQGCPESKEKAKEIKYGRLILSGVAFEGGTYRLATGSTTDLDRVYQSLIDWPEVTIELQVHTDNSISPKASLKLSQQRADVIREYLIGKGISSSRISAIGKGSGDPIADNSSVQGRRLNNRVEIHRTDGR
ncbi:MAG: OmpA family protein [Chitinispirillaceae bacterium]|nr:OmpA family protein [Chitinispirillaceae bacterium]